MIHKTTATTCTDMKKKSKKPVKKKVVIFVKGLAIRDEKKNNSKTWLEDNPEIY